MKARDEMARKKESWLRAAMLKTFGKIAAPVLGALFIVAGAQARAEMVRFNCKAFPTPTPVYYFARQPFFLNRERMKAIIAQMKTDPSYQDIRECEAAINGEPYLYSIDLMSEKYAKALANGAEAREADD